MLVQKARVKEDKLGHITVVKRELAGVCVLEFKIDGGVAKVSDINSFIIYVLLKFIIIYPSEKRFTFIYEGDVL